MSGGGTIRNPRGCASNNDSGHESSTSLEDWTKGLETNWPDDSLLLLQTACGTSSDAPLQQSVGVDDDRKMAASCRSVDSLDQLSSLLSVEETKKPAAISDTIDHQNLVNAAASKKPEPDVSKPKKRRSGSSSPRQRKKRAKGTPKRPLTAYNLFFRDRREVLMANHRLSFQELGKVVGREWHDLSSELHHQYDRRAKIETDRYHREMDIYHENKRKERDKALREEEIMAVSAATEINQLHASMTDNMRILPPGEEVLLPGSDGVLRAYRVEYKAVRMKQSDFDSSQWQTLIQQPNAHDDRKRPPSQDR